MTVVVQPWLQCVRLQVADGVELSSPDGVCWRIARDTMQVPFRLDAAMSDVVSGICRKACALHTLAARLDEPDGASIAAQLHRLWTAGVLIETIVEDERELAALCTSGRETRLLPPAVDPWTRVILSEQACVRPAGGQIVVEALEQGAAVTIGDARLRGVAGALFEPATCEEIARRRGVGLDLVCALVALLAGMGAVHEAGAPRPPASAHVRRWAFADRWLHARSRRDRHVGGYGATYPLRQRMPDSESPACASSDSAMSPGSPAPIDARRVDLPPVDLTRIAAHDPPFTRVLEDRRSIRTIAPRPIRIGQLAEFLFRVAHPTARRLPDGSEQAMRPFPSAGGLYELDLYPLVHRCEGLGPALYRYDGPSHALQLVAPPAEQTRSLLVDAQRSSGMTDAADVLILLVANFARVNWKYESMAYALVLKNVGVLYQTMYLVATAMGLAPCALGGGSSLRFCELTGADYWERSPVGEFLLGAREETAHD